MNVAGMERVAAPPRAARSKVCCCRASRAAQSAEFAAGTRRTRAGGCLRSGVCREGD